MEASALSHPVGLGRISLAEPLLRLRSDDQLLSLFRAGHDEAFGIMHDRYRQRLFAYARQMLGGSASDAEDVLQDVFLRAYHALRADRRPLALRAWLYRVAHNRCIDQLRRPSPAAEDIYDLNRGVQVEPAAAAERREDLRRLVDDVRRLPEQQRSALLMREMEGLSYNELADALGVTIPAIKSLLVRARVGLVEAVEARDTACVEIRTDVAAAFDRGVRVSGRSRRHLRECAGCRDYRSALRGVEKQLNGLAPASGPLATLAKILGVSGAGSGAAVGGSAAIGGGTGVVAGSGVTVGTGVVAATATKVAAVVAAAAVVGGGAATMEKVEHRVSHAHKAAVAAPVVRAPSAAVSTLQRRAAVNPRAGTSRAAVPGKHAAAASAPRVARVQEGAGAVVSSPGAPAYERTTGGLLAPDDGTTAATTDAGATLTSTDAAGGSGTAIAGDVTTAGAGSTASDAGATGTSTTATATDPTGTSASSPAGPTATTTTAAGSTRTGGAAAPAGTGAGTTTAQGATTPAAG